jgi:flagellar biosynthesis chaperone FliJ
VLLRIDVFVFRLKKMLEFVLLREKQKKIEVAAIQQRMVLLKQHKNFLEETNQQILEVMPQRLKEGMQWVLYQNSKLDFNRKKVKEVIEQISVEEERLYYFKEELKKLSYKRKALESLKEKRFKEYTEQKNKKDQKILEEVWQQMKGT